MCMLDTGSRKAAAACLLLLLSSASPKSSPWSQKVLMPYEINRKIRKNIPGSYVRDEKTNKKLGWGRTILLQLVVVFRFAAAVRIIRRIRAYAKQQHEDVPRDTMWSAWLCCHVSTCHLLLLQYVQSFSTPLCSLV